MATKSIRREEFEDQYRKICELYDTQDRESTLLADQLLAGFVPELKSLIPRASTCRRFHKSQKRRNEIFKFMELFDKKGFGFNTITFSLASTFFSEHYMYIDDKKRLTLPWGPDDYFEENDVDTSAVWRKMEELRILNEEDLEGVDWDSLCD